jgi:hypothetical protein
LAAWLFRRALALVYLLAFWSVWRQALGLIGRNGILPVGGTLDFVRGRYDTLLERLLAAPTLFWIGSSDTAIAMVCIGGMALATLLLAGVLPLTITPLLWLLYLSITTVGRDFFAFQWDALLLEVGFLAIFIAPTVLMDRFSDAGAPPRIGVLLFYWLLFRLVFFSGLVKLTSGDPTWRDLTALAFHYETQPLPTPIAWYAYQLPLWVQRVSTAATLAIELVAPFSMLAPRRVRLSGAALMVALQLTIALTGNYAFFNLLTAALCLFLLDDGARKLFTRENWIRMLLLVGVAVVTVPASLGFPGLMPRAVDSFRIVNRYGLFAVMTTARPEIIIEASVDGDTWEPYEFKYKPGDLRRAPGWVAPHQPRLDWQMWFAALGSPRDEPWFSAFLRRLLDRSPEVVALLRSVPLEGRPPRAVRAVLYQYHFADRTTRARDGVWWTRERLRIYAVERAGS